MSGGAIPADRYTRVAIALHWLIALAILGQFASGLWMVDAVKVPETQAQAFQVYQLHKSVGLTVLVLSLVRLAWRLLHRPPPLPYGMSKGARTAAHVTHAFLYVAMIAMPLLGWAMVSASPFGFPTVVFGWFTWPHIPWFFEATDKPALEALFKSAHRYLAYATGAALMLHVLAAMKHQFVDRDGLLSRMMPFLSRGARA